MLQLTARPGGVPHSGLVLCRPPLLTPCTHWVAPQHLATSACRGMCGSHVAVARAFPGSCLLRALPFLYTHSRTHPSLGDSSEPHSSFGAVRTGQMHMGGGVRQPDVRRGACEPQEPHPEPPARRTRDAHLPRLLPPSSLPAPAVRDRQARLGRGAHHPATESLLPCARYPAPSFRGCPAHAVLTMAPASSTRSTSFVAALN